MSCAAHSGEKNVVGEYLGGLYEGDTWKLEEPCEFACTDEHRPCKHATLITKGAPGDFDIYSVPRG